MPRAAAAGVILSILLIGCRVADERGQPAVRDGADFDLDSYEGSILVVNFWGTWCPPCKVEIPSLIRLQSDFGAEGVHFAGIAVPVMPADDSTMRREVTEYFERRGMNYDVFLDPRFELTSVLNRRWGVGGGVPATVIVDADGRVRARHVGLPLDTDGRIDPYGVIRRELEEVLARR